MWLLYFYIVYHSVTLKRWFTVSVCGCGADFEVFCTGLQLLIISIMDQYVDYFLHNSIACLVCNHLENCEKCPWLQDDHKTITNKLRFLKAKSSHVHIGEAENHEMFFTLKKSDYQNKLQLICCQSVYVSALLVCIDGMKLSTFTQALYISTISTTFWRQILYFLLHCMKLIT